jgi:hypothetical protein
VINEGINVCLSEKDIHDRSFKRGGEMKQLSSELRGMKESNITTEHCRSIAHRFRKSEPTDEPSSREQSDNVLQS